MSEIRVNNITNRDGSTGTTVAGIPVVDSTSHFVVPTGRTGQRYADGGENIVRDGLVLHLDAKYSYPSKTGITTTTDSLDPDVYTWYDMSGNGNDAYLQRVNSSLSFPTYNSSNGGSLSFTGYSPDLQYARISTFDSDKNSALSVFCWVKINDLTSESFDGVYFNWIINKRNTVTPNSNSWQLNIRNSYPQAAFWGTNDNLITPSGADFESLSSSTIQENQWYYIGFVTNGINGGYLNTYINDTINATITLTGDRGSATKPIDIGKAGWSNESSPGYQLQGNIAQVSIYNRALTAAEVSQNFEALRSRFGI